MKTPLEVESTFQEQGVLRLRSAAPHSAQDDKDECLVLGVRCSVFGVWCSVVGLGWSVSGVSMGLLVNPAARFLVSVQVLDTRSKHASGENALKRIPKHFSGYSKRVRVCLRG